MRVILYSVLVLCLLGLAGCVTASGQYPGGYSVFSNELIRSNPASMNNTIVFRGDFNSVRLENITLHNVTFLESSGSNVRMKNVTFVNCRFINTTFSNAVLENVTFKGGLLTCKTNADNSAERTHFTNSVFTNVVFDGTSFENTILQVNNSSIHIKNLTVLSGVEPLISGANIQLTLDSCVFMRYIPVIAAISGNSTLNARSCIFDRSTFGSSVFTSTRFSECVTYSGPVYFPPQESTRSGKR